MREVPGNALLLVLRGVNLNPDARPEDMIAVRVWANANEIVTLRRFRLLAVNDLREAFERMTPPPMPGSFLASLCEGLTERMNGVVEGMDDDLDALEEMEIEQPQDHLRDTLLRLRRRAIPLRRFLAPQRDALSGLLNERIGLLSDRDRVHLRETADELSRIVEALDSIRERAGLLHEELVNTIQEQMNKTSYVLTVVAAVFLPLSFLTGLLGINVGGIPGTEYPLAFAAVCVALLVLGAAEVWIFRKLRWL